MPAAAVIPDKPFFKIGEVAEIAGVEPYVLRYWETEFRTIRPEKTRTNQRMYRKRDVETVFDTIKETLEKGEKIKISGFGNFVVRDKNARAGRNPQTGEEITISARRVLTFKPSQVLKNALNGQPIT